MDHWIYKCNLFKFQAPEGTEHFGFQEIKSQQIHQKTWDVEEKVWYTENSYDTQKKQPFKEMYLLQKKWRCIYLLVTGIE